MKLYFFKLSESGNSMKQTEIEVTETAKLFKVAEQHARIPYNCGTQIRKSEMNHVLFDNFNYWYFTDHPTWDEPLKEFISAHEAKRTEYLNLAGREEKNYQQHQKSYGEC